MKKQIKTLLIFGFLFFTASLILAQENSAIELLDNAKTEYKNGQIEKSLNYLKQAETIHNSRQLNAEIYLYQARVYAMKRALPEAKKYTRKYLVIKPQTKFDDDEFTEITTIAAESKISPRMAFGASYSFIDTQISSEQNISLISSQNETVVQKFSSKVNGALSIYYQYYLHRHISLFAEININKTGYSRSLVINQITADEMYFSVGYTYLPLALKFDVRPIFFYRKQLPLNISLGGGYFFRFRNKATAYAGGTTEYEQLTNGINVDNYISAFGYGTWGEVTAGYRFGFFNVHASLRYFQNLTEIGTTENQYSIGTGDEILFEHYQLVDKTILNHIWFSAGISYYFRFRIFNDIFNKDKTLSASYTDK